MCRARGKAPGRNKGQIGKRKEGRVDPRRWRRRLLVGVRIRNLDETLGSLFRIIRGITKHRLEEEGGRGTQKR